MKCSAIFAIAFVIAIGLILFSTVCGGNIFGKDVMRAIFHCSGTITWRTDEFIIAQIGSAKMCESENFIWDFIWSCCFMNFDLFKFLIDLKGRDNIFIGYLWDGMVSEHCE